MPFSCDNSYYRYIIEIGRGASGVVWKAFNIHSGKVAAIKVFYPSRWDLEDADRVASIHRLIFLRCNERLSLFAEFLNRDTYALDNCLAFELGGMSLDGVCCSYSVRPAIIHTDIKPANVVLVSDRTVVDRFLGKPVLCSTAIKLVDLDDAVLGPAERRYLCGTDSYRAPEVCAGFSWSNPIDAFSIGCVAVELWTSRPLFQASSSSAETLAAMEKVIGPFPSGFFKDAPQSLLFFTSARHRKVIFDWTICGPEAMGRLNGIVPLRALVLAEDMYTFSSALLH
ncbi:kinase-like domain-containing protein [Mycena epipterygia]|nr:kinase-like domain-containing protein [Mycena epipterygia]